MPRPYALRDEIADHRCDTLAGKAREPADGTIAWIGKGAPRVQGVPHASRMDRLPALQWEDSFVRNHQHHHHRFDSQSSEPGAEMECSRGCPYHCTFCAKDNFRDSYRKRPPAVILQELDGLLRQGVEYIYFIDEIYLPDRYLLEQFVERSFRFGIQTRIDLWNERMLKLLGQAGCVSVEAGVESITPEGRQSLDKNCRMSTEDLTLDLLAYHAFPLLASAFAAHRRRMRTRRSG